MGSLACIPGCRILCRRERRRADLTSNQDALLAPDQLRLDQTGDALVFRLENQSCARWGIPSTTHRGQIRPQYGNGRLAPDSGVAGSHGLAGSPRHSWRSSRRSRCLPRGFLPTTGTSTLSARRYWSNATSALPSWPIRCGRHPAARPCAGLQVLTCCCATTPQDWLWVRAAPQGRLPRFARPFPVNGCRSPTCEDSRPPHGHCRPSTRRSRWPPAALASAQSASLATALASSC
jgi:hypothetical protein